MTQPTRSHETVARLKELLFEQESREIDNLAGRIAEVQKRAGSDDQFRRAVAQALEQALEDAEQRRPKEIAAAMAPMVLRTLRTEIESPDMRDRIAGIMYPRMGELVKRYVASAMRDMMQELNRRLEQSSFGQSRFFVWLTTVATGQTRAELGMTATQRLDVVEMYLVRRGSGALVHHWQRADGPATGAAETVPGAASAEVRGANRDVLVSGFLAAITALAEEAFEARKESLRTLDLDDHRIYLRGSPDYLLAAKCSGTAPAGIDGILDAELIKVLGELQTIEQARTTVGGTAAGDLEQRSAYAGLLANSADSIESRAVARVGEIVWRQKMQVLRLIGMVLAIPLLALGGWYGWTSWSTRDVTGRAEAALAEIPQLKGYPIRTHVEWGGGRIWVSGLVPDDATRRQVLGRLHEIAPSIAVDEAVSVLPRPDLDARVGAEALKRATERARHRIEAVSGDLATALERAGSDSEKQALGDARTAMTATLGDLASLEPARDGTSGAGKIGAALAALRAAADKLGAIAGTEAALQIGAPRDAIDAVEALVLVTDRVSALVAALEQKRTVAPIARRIDTVDERLVQRIAELEKRIEAMRPAAPTPREKLAAFVRESAVFFSNDVDYRDPTAAETLLAELSSLIKQAGIAVRVVGYTDEAGTSARNSPLAQSRADKVAADLARRGVPATLLLAVGRPNGSNLAPGAGVDSPNRRVEFEIAFSGEPGGRP